MMRKESTTGALAIGRDHPGLGVARSLGRRGIPVCVIDDSHCISKYSRYVQRVVRVKNLRDEQETVNSVLAVGRDLNLRNWVLLPTRDETVAAFSRHRRKLDTFFRVPVPKWNTLRWTWTKKNTYTLAERLAIPCPRTLSVASADELPSLCEFLPLAIKPAIKEKLFYDTGAKAWRADTVDQLHRLYTRARRYIKTQEILLQEIIPGDGSTQYSFCAFFKDGRPHSSLVALRQRPQPKEFGRAATYVETADEPLLAELSHRLLAAIDYYGLVEVEFKRGPRDGVFKLLDVNSRIRGFHSLGAAAGVDFSYLLFADQLNRPISPCRGQAGIGWVRLLSDTPTGLSSVLRGSQSAASWLGTISRAQVESVFTKDDPLPFVAEAFMLPYLLRTKYL